MTALATVADLGVRLGLDLTADTRAAAILTDVSAAVRGYTGRTFTKTTDQSVEVDVCCGKATLPDGPVISIDSVKVDGDDITYTWTSGRTIRDLLACGPVTVVYTWGYETVPDEIVGVVCQIAGRAYGTNPQQAAAPSESLGGWSIGATPAAAAAGAFGLMHGERDTLDRYRFRPSGPIQQDVWA